jgi:hypothetical protein
LLPLFLAKCVQRLALHNRNVQTRTNRGFHSIHTRGRDARNKTSPTVSYQALSHTYQNRRDANAFCSGESQGEILALKQVNN